ncbi:MAG: hypothetical protein QOH72_3294 [Solirubrobacteraceae bacterium]|nr:hypothetical protein [Solirubrobacteraceae bacterium]
MAARVLEHAHVLAVGVCALYPRVRVARALGEGGGAAEPGRREDDVDRVGTRSDAVCQRVDEPRAHRRPEVAGRQLCAHPVLRR